MSKVDDIVASVLPAALLSVFGDPVIMPDGSETVGVFDRYGKSATAPWTEVGLVASLTAQPSPSVELVDDLAATLAVNDRLTIAGIDYLVAAMPQANGSGLTKVILMLERTGEPYARWQ